MVCSPHLPALRGIAKGSSYNSIQEQISYQTQPVGYGITTIQQPLYDVNEQAAQNQTYGPQKNPLDNWLSAKLNEEDIAESENTNLQGLTTYTLQTYGTIPQQREWQIGATSVHTREYGIPLYIPTPIQNPSQTKNEADQLATQIQQELARMQEQEEHLLTH